jgi:hypothetical protein
MSLLFSEKLMIFFRIYLDLKYKKKERVLEEFLLRSDDLHKDLCLVINEGYPEINGIYDDLEVIFKREGTSIFTLILRFKQDWAKGYLEILQHHAMLPGRNGFGEPDYDEVLRQSVSQLLPQGNAVEIKIKREQAV